jgi:hypothetical protein
MSSVEELKLRVEQLERELADCRSRLSAGDDAAAALPRASRPKINVLSAEVVDSNPYRFGIKRMFLSLRVKIAAGCSIHQTALTIQQLSTDRKHFTWTMFTDENNLQSAARFIYLVFSLLTATST